MGMQQRAQVAELSNGWHLCDKTAKARALVPSRAACSEPWSAIRWAVAMEKRQWRCWVRWVAASPATKLKDVCEAIPSTVFEYA